MTPNKDHASGVEKVNKLFPAARSIILCNVKNKIPKTAPLNFSYKASLNH
jgi:hypothetical protein